MQGLFVDVTLKKKGFCQAIPNFKPYVLRRLPNGNVEAVGGSYWIKNEGGSAAGNQTTSFFGPSLIYLLFGTES